MTYCTSCGESDGDYACGGDRPCYPETLTGSSVILDWHGIRSSDVMPPERRLVAVAHSEGIDAGSVRGRLWYFTTGGREPIDGVRGWAEWPHDVTADHPSWLAYGAE